MLHLKALWSCLSKSYVRSETIETPLPELQSRVRRSLSIQRNKICDSVWSWHALLFLSGEADYSSKGGPPSIARRYWRKRRFPLPMSRRRVRFLIELSSLAHDSN